MLHVRHVERVHLYNWTRFDGLLEQISARGGPISRPSDSLGPTHYVERIFLYTWTTIGVIGRMFSIEKSTYWRVPLGLREQTFGQVRARRGKGHEEVITDTHFFVFLICLWSPGMDLT